MVYLAEIFRYLREILSFDRPGIRGRYFLACWPATEGGSTEGVLGTSPERVGQWLLFGGGPDTREPTSKAASTYRILTADANGAPREHGKGKGPESR